MAETPVAGSRKRTATRGQRVSRPRSDLSSGLNYISSPSARQVQINNPQIALPENPLADASKKFAWASKQLENYQKQNQDKWKSEAEVNAQALIDSEKAKGLSGEQIQENFRNGQYKDIQSQLQMDVFNSVHGSVLADNYFNNPQGDGYKATEEWNQKFLAAPFEQRQYMDFEKHLAKTKNAFREKFGGNVKLLTGGAIKIAQVSEKLRKDHAEHYERRLDEDRTQMLVSSTTTQLEAFRQQNDLDGPEATLSSEEHAARTASRVDVAMRAIGQRLGSTGPEIKRAKLALAEQLVNNASLKGSVEEQKFALESALNLITTKLPGPVQSLLNDESTFSTKGGNAGQPGNTRVRDRAASLKEKIERNLGDINGAKNLSGTVSLVLNSLRGGRDDEAFQQIFSQQNTSNFNGSGKPLNQVLSMAIDKARQELASERGADGQPLPFTTRNTRLLHLIDSLPEDQLPKGLKSFRLTASSMNSLYRKVAQRGGQQGVEVIDRADEDAFRRSYSLYKSLEKWDESHLDKVFPRDSKERQLMEFFDMDKTFGQANTAEDQFEPSIQQQIAGSSEEFTGTGIPAAILTASKAIQDNEGRPKVTDDDVDTLYTAISGDVENENSGFWNTLFDREESYISAGKISWQVKQKIKDLIRHKRQYMGNNADSAEKIQDSIEETLQGRLFDMNDNTFFIPRNSPFRTNKQEAVRYTKDRLTAFKERYNIQGDLTVTPLTGSGLNEDRYIIIDSKSGRPVHLDNRSLSLGNSIFQINFQTVKNHTINYNLGES